MSRMSPVAVVASQSGANKVYTQLPHFVYGQVLLPLYQATDNFRYFSFGPEKSSPQILSPLPRYLPLCVLNVFKIYAICVVPQRVGQTLTDYGGASSTGCRVQGAGCRGQ